MNISKARFSLTNFIGKTDGLIKIAALSEQSGRIIRIVSDELSGQAPSARLSMAIDHNRLQIAAATEALLRANCESQSIRLLSIKLSFA